MAHRLLFADNLVLLASSEQGMQHALNLFSAACDQAGMNISTKETEHYTSPKTHAGVRCK